MLRDDHMSEPAMTIAKRMQGRRRPGANAVRTANTRNRIIQAAIACLHELGYSATSTELVIQRAGASRGAMLHHFPTRVDLMLDTAKYIVAEQSRWYDEQLEQIADPRQHFLAITELAWQAMRQAPAIALFEIMVATRSDPTLQARFPPVAREIEAIQQRGMWILAKRAGITDREAVRTLNDMLIAGLRGLSIHLLFADDEAAVERAFRMLLDQQRAIVGSLLE